MAERIMRRDSGHLCVVGVQWGDEGKGKVVDMLAAEFDVIVRYQGGANAGHTVMAGDRKYVFHLIPSGILQEGKVCAIGNGVVVDPKELIAELDALKRQGIDREENLYVSDRAHVVLPYHRVLDASREEGSQGSKIGTTLRGIGPCYAHKAARQGIRMVDLVDRERFRSRLEAVLPEKNAELVKIYGKPPLDLGEIVSEYSAYAERLRPRVCDVGAFLREEDRSGKRLLFEGAQGSLLDIDFGTYPYVTSSHTSFLGLGAGTGFSPRRIETVLGVLKAYATRVGEGPFPTELRDSVGERLRKGGDEFGATTGRPRRCGWLDLPALRHAVRFGDVDALAITKLDVLNGFDEILVATHYLEDGRRRDDFPASLDASLRPVYASFPGWKGDVCRCRKWEDLPPEARRYLQSVADGCGRPIAMVSVGTDRHATIRLDPWLAPSGGGESAVSERAVGRRP
ncbi:MAG: adenylosuccinate synthase [Planctomycetota bacterium]